MFNRRKTQRVPAFVSGIIKRSEDDQANIKCRIRNQSAGGAMLNVDNSDDVPDEFDLVIPQQETTLHARTCWRGHDYVGVEFPDPNEAKLVLDADAVSPVNRIEHRPLRRLSNRTS